MNGYYIRKITTIGKGRYKIELEDGFPFVLYKGELSKYGIEEESILSEEKYQMICKEVLLKRCKMRAMHLLEKQDRLELDVRRKLSDGFYPEDIIDETIAFLYSFHYLDDERYIKNYISYYGATKSRAEIVHNLRLKGLDKESIERGFELLEEEDESLKLVSDEEKITEILHKKNYDPHTANEKEKARIFRHLVGKGFKTEDILRIIHG